MQASASATMLPPVSMYHEAQVEEGSMSPPPPALIWLTPGGDRKEQLRNLIEYSEDILGEFALSPQHSRSWAGEEKFKKPRDPFSKPPTTDGRRISIGLNRVRPSTPIDDSVKRLNLNRLHKPLRCASLFISPYHFKILKLYQQQKKVTARALWEVNLK